MVLLSPQSQSSSWDVIRGGYGPDVQIMDKALRSVFERYTIDPKRCSIGGFSDGASYALSVGTTNGDLFTHIVAFSPGFMRPGYLVRIPIHEVYASQHFAHSVLGRCVCLPMQVHSCLVSLSFVLWQAAALAQLSFVKLHVPSNIADMHLCAT